MDGYNRYLHEIMRICGLVIDRRGALVAQQLADLDEHSRSAQPPSVAERRFLTLFDQFAEISGCFDTLGLLQRLPISGKGLRPAQAIRMNVECYLSEVHILRERLLNNLKIVCRVAQRCTTRERYMTIGGVERALKAYVRNALDPICEIRGSHIHDRRYGDPDLRQLGTLDLLVDRTGKIEPQLLPALRSKYASECRRVKREWSERIEKNNTKTRELLDEYFDALYPIVFDVRAGVLGVDFSPKES